MKKRNLFYALTAGIALFSACNNNSDEFTPGDDSAAQQIVLQVASSGDGLTTRAGRPLYGEEAKQTIENVKVLICKAADGTIVYDKLIQNWNGDGATPYNQNGHGRETVIELTKKLDAGIYKVYGIGYSSDSKYKVETATLDVHLKDLITNTVQIFKGDLKITLEQNGQELKDKAGEEIFAGSLDLTIEKGKGFKKPVVLHRQVAGTFGYFKEVPYIAEAAKLRLVAYNRNQDLVLGQFNPNVMAENGTTNNTAMFVVNGTNQISEDKHVIYEINLADWYKNGTQDIKDENKDGLIDNTHWQVPSALQGKAKFKTGSFFGGNFVIPFAKGSSEEKTFVLELTNNDGTSALRSWIVKLPEDDKQSSEHDLYTWNTSSFNTKKNTDNSTTYNVVRNHLYGIGKKTSDNPTDPDKEDPNKEDPESLNNKQELILQVNDNWEIIHKMELD